MDFLKPPLWKEGDFLEPQHLQYLNLHIRANSIAINNTIFESHGVHELQINTSNLKKGVIEVNKLTVMLENGVYINYPYNALLSSRSFTDAWVDGDKDFNIYIGVPSVTEKQLDKAGKALLKDKQVQQVAFSDLYDVNNKNVSQVNVLQQYVGLFWENELAEQSDYSYFKLITLSKNSGAINISSSNYPILANVLCYPPAIRSIKQILHSLQEQSNFFIALLGDLRKKIILSIDVKVLFYMQLCKSINYYSVHLQCLLEAQNSHPRSMYLLILQLIISNMSLINTLLSLPCFLV